LYKTSNSYQEEKMQSQEETIQTLVNLGLTVMQTKVYIALAKSGTSTARTTAKAAKVASQDVYHTLIELQEKGLVEKIISKPNRYRPISMEEAISILLQRRNKQTDELKKAAFEIVQRFQGVDKFENNETGDFIMIPQGETSVNRLSSAWKTAQTNIDLICELREGMGRCEKTLS
jgi:sugar-specific transcriptional regulator TrmB